MLQPGGSATVRAAQLSYEIVALGPGDVVPCRHGSPGVALDLQPGRFPSGARGGLFPQEEAVLRDVLEELHGLVRWGGDDAPPEESHLGLAVPLSDPRLALLAESTWWAGLAPDPATRASAARSWRSRTNPWNSATTCSV